MGVKRDATEEEIKKTYRKLVMEYHPDRNRNDPHCEEHLKEINEAYQVLGNEENRKRYDTVTRGPFKDHLFSNGDLNDELAAILREFFRSGFSMKGPGGCKGRMFGRGMCGRRWRIMTR